MIRFILNIKPLTKLLISLISFFALFYFTLNASASVGTSTAVSLYGGTVPTSYGVISWASELFDTNNLHSTVSNTSRITIKDAGYYQINGHVSCAYGNYAYVMLSFSVNGTEIMTPVNSNNYNSGQNPSGNLSVIRYLAVNDYVEMSAYKNTSSCSSNTNYNYMHFDLAKIEPPYLQDEFSFLDLTDTPDTYTTSTYSVVINDTVDGLDFAEITGGISTSTETGTTTIVNVDTEFIQSVLLALLFISAFFLSAFYWIYILKK